VDLAGDMDETKEIKEQRQEQRQLARAVDLAGDMDETKEIKKRGRELYFFGVYIGGHSVRREGHVPRDVARLPRSGVFVWEHTSQ